MNGVKRAKKSGKNAKKTVNVVSPPQLFDLTQGMPKAEDAGEKSEVEVFKPKQETPPATPQVPTAPIPRAQDTAQVQVPPPQVQVPPPQVQVSLPQPGVVYRPKPLQITQPAATPVQRESFPVPVITPAPQEPLPVPVISPAPHRIEYNREPSAEHEKKRPTEKHRHRSGKRKEKSDLDKVYDYVNGRKTLDLPEGVQGAAEALPQKKKKKTYVPVKEGKGKTRPATLKAERQRRRKQEERLTYMIVACVVLFLIASGFLLRILWNYRRTAAEYAGLTDTYVTRQTDNAAQDATGEEPYPPLDIDFPGLFALNNDLAAWIHVPGCDISYPVVQTTDNDYYLNHTFLKNMASGGAIFMDYADHADFSDFNTFLYGHNMQDGSMFGTLHRLWQDEELADKEPYFYVYLKSGGVRKYQIISYYRDHGDSESYLRVSLGEDKQAYADMILRKSAVNPEKSPLTASQTLTSDDSLVTLSTCHGGVNSGQRFLVHGKLIGVY